MPHQTHMQRALELATKSAQQGTGPFGCVIVKNDEVVAEGWNQVTELNDPSAHAEMQALRKACKNLKDFQLTDCEVYTSCYPCPMCLAALYWARPQKIYYLNTSEQAAAIGFDDASIYQEINQLDNEKKIPLQKIDLENELQAFEAWAANPEKIEY